MRIIYSAIFITLLFTSFIVAQPAAEKPLTQTEYVQLLYMVEKLPTKMEEVVEAVRKRGIGFVLTDGLRGLTATKSRSDVTLKRTLEEADRRRINPESFVLPSEKESSAAIEKARELTLQATEEMPDFIVKQVINRGVSYAGTNKFTPTDRLVVGVGYRANGQEEYKLISVNGIAQADVTGKGTYDQAGGTTSSGEFVTVLETVFKPDSKTKFEVFNTDVLRGHRAIVYKFDITRDLAKQQIVAYRNIEQQTIAGMRGKIWIDRDTFRVLRLESEATEIPDTFPVRAANRAIDYDWITINNTKYMLPQLSEVRLTMREQREVYETRNEIRFRDYQKYDVDIKVLDDDEGDAATDTAAPAAATPSPTPIPSPTVSPVLKTKP
jgi:hypothetical protein